MDPNHFLPPEFACRRIAEDILARTGAALFDGDFEAFSGCFSFPHSVETEDRIQELAHPNALRAIFDNVRRQFNRNGITRMERNIVEASFRDSETISCTHQSRLMNGTQLVQRPYPVFSVIKRDEAHIWRLSSGVYALSSDPEWGNAVTSEILICSERLD